ncbi:MAG: hypothetical protein EBU67_08850 [Actinobacteria bacterium]|nr:hypothetical protein [Actinomycetota bacterium]
MLSLEAKSLITSQIHGGSLANWATAFAVASFVIKSRDVCGVGVHSCVPTFGAWVETSFFVRAFSR